MNINDYFLERIISMGCFCTKQKIEIKSKKYAIKEILGEGGFSTVYLAEEIASRKLYAVKKIICHSAEDEVTALLEISIHNKVKHETIVKLIAYDSLTLSGHVKSYYYLLLPYYEKGTLLQELDRRGRSLKHFRPVEIYEIFLKICEGVRAFHECEPPIAHRDLKTGNVLMDNAASPVIMDLGSATEARVVIHSNSEAQALQDLAAERSSMPYRAPELFHVEAHSTIDERTDIWSLGCILYALCFFKSPFDSVYERGDSVALAVLSGNIFFSEGQSYGKEMESLIRLMLQVNHTERPFINTIIERASLALENAQMQNDALSV